ncbi:hypothetical protein TSUD_409060 [Trifolium subterraneum]|uniref:Reverse transcriptase domain-containing protein n=1 Tax=Trifolium subterraneum TaxID=3900 RepID=A0A2Z6PGV4_TRISU|nr:hypothetical protein TSUD_409060 [Trifolium subterraneum]
MQSDATRRYVLSDMTLIRRLDHGPFNQFIAVNGLVDLPLSDVVTLGLRMVQLRGLSDHCPLVLSVDDENWGPRPVRMLKCWHDTLGFRQFVIDKWRSLQVDGWGVFVGGNLDFYGSVRVMQTPNISFSFDRSSDALSVITVVGERVEGVQAVRQAVFSYFSSHFRAGNVARTTVEGLQFSTLSLAEGVSLVKLFSIEEVKAVIWDCDSYKSRGLDGITFGFLKEFLSVMQVDIMRFITEFHRNVQLSKCINSTFITLIPKVDSPQKLNDFRPISLVGSLYKILVKILANRLWLVMGSVILETQTTFVKDRQILDGILIANEVVDEARKSQKELLLFKVDFEKAYDSVDWGYLDMVMINSSPTEEFLMERGLRQGDPLSPFLFLLAAEGLNVMMIALVQSNLFIGYSHCSENPTVVSHLPFADDTLLLGVKSWANVRALRVVLVLFEKVSRLKVNFHKSMLVGVNIGESWLTEAASVLGCKVGKVPFMYLDLPVRGDPRRLSFWEPIVYGIRTRLSRWTTRLLLFGGRLILLKSFLTSLPVYAISFFKAPLGIISSLESLLSNFFWGEGHRKIAWVRWRNVCLGQDHEGLGVRQLREFNTALLGKWCWQMLVDRDGMWFSVLTARYGGVPLRVRYRCLYDLANNKSISVADMCQLGWEEDGAGWQWRRQLWVWENELLAECTSLLCGRRNYN